MEQQKNLPEVWLRGALPDIPALLQPVAHALLQAREEVERVMHDFTDTLLWQTLGKVASPGFHLQHLTGVLDRLFTYARGQSLSEEQLHYLSQEGKPAPDITFERLVLTFHQQVEKALAQLKATEEQALTETRGVGRAQLPSTVLGLLFHAAEHTTRHLGQLLVTVQVLKQRE